VQKRNGPAWPFRFRGGFCGPQPLFSWGFAQCETKRVVSGLSLGKRRASPPSIRFQPERNRTINGLAVFLSVVRLPLSPEKLSPSMVWRLFSWIIGRHLPLRKPVLSTSQNHLHARCWTPAGFRTGFWDPPSIHLKENWESHLPTHSPHHAFQIACICCMCRT
jgi:hypothetical protein